MQKVSLKIFTLFIFLLIANIISGQSSNVEKFKNDLVILKNTFETKYPSLYRFSNKTSIDKLFEDCSLSVNKKTTERDFYRIIKLILSKIEDGHLGCSPSDTLVKTFNEKEKYFPLSLYFLDKRAFVDCSSINSLPSGTEILEINSKAINNIRQTLFNYIVSDGKIETKKYWILKRSFWFYYNLVYGQQEKFKVKYKDIHGKTSFLIVNSDFKKNIECKSLTDKEESKLLDIKYPNANTAILTIQTFAYDELESKKLDFVDFLASSFKDIKQKNIKFLIIDLRGNGGGRDGYGSLLYSYLTDNPFKYYAKLETSTKALTDKDHPNLALQRPSPNNFNGKVYLIINGLSFSATSEFCTIVKNNNRATFIGEETGGTYCGNTSGDFIDEVLPFSKISVSIPTTKYTMVVTDTKNTDRGIIPDYSIKPTIRDLIDKKDAQLNFALKLTTQE